jgi:hypothetical protein
VPPSIRGVQWRPERKAYAEGEGALFTHVADAAALASLGVAGVVSADP